MDREAYIPLVENALRKAERRLRAVQRDLTRVEEAPRLLYETELMKGAHPKPYDKEVRVFDYVDNREVVIALEPGVAFQTQLQKRFRQARRLADSQTQVLQRLAIVEKDIARLQAHRATLDGEGWQVDESLLPRPRRAKDAPSKELPYREYRSRAGRPIWVGKSGTANDTLTFKVASPHAGWFHASGYAGAHVVVQKKRGEQIDPLTRQDAALLAAHFSKAPPHDWVEVAVTEVKFVRKFAGAKTGQVHISREAHERIVNDPDAAKALLAVAQV